MKLDKVANSGNDEFYTPSYAIKPLIQYVNKNFTVWCPFDTSQSNIVKDFKTNGNNVITSHIDDGLDFFNYTPEQSFDVIISNPPYSKKFEVFQRLFDLDCKFAMLVGVVGLFESQKRFELFSSNKFEIMWMNKRISYFKSFEDQKPSLNPPFSSVWITKGLLPKDNIFELIYK